MPMTIYAFHDYPHDFAVTKIDAPIEECAFLLDFRRPLERARWFGVLNGWVGPTVGLKIPVVHRAERSGEFVVSVRRSEPYFVDLPRMWREHNGQIRSIIDPPIDGLELVADFGRHFPDDCKVPGSQSRVTSQVSDLIDRAIRTSVELRKPVPRTRQRPLMAGSSVWWLMSSHARRSKKGAEAP